MSRSDRKLPAMTMALLAFGKWLQHNILWLLLMLALAGAGCTGSRSPSGAGFCRRLPHRAAGVWQDLAEVPGGAVCAHAVDAADGRIAAGAVAGYGGAVDLVAAGFEGGA